MATLDFDTVYRMDRSVAGGPFQYMLMVAGATSDSRPLPTGGSGATFFRFCSNEDSPQPVFYMFGSSVEEGPDGTIRIDDALAKASGTKAVYRFRPVTVKLAEEVKDSISKYDSTVGKIKSDDDLQNYFRSGLIPDGWSRVCNEND